MEAIQRITGYIIRSIIIALVAVAIMAVSALIIGVIVMWLWNWIVVDTLALGMPTLSYWEAFGLYWLCSILFKASVTGNSKD